MSDGRRERSIDTTRTDALSDGVFAIATTLLVLNLGVPSIPRDDADTELPRAIGGLATDLLSYVLSFLVIAGFWMAHRAIFRHIMDVNRPLSWLNVLFLMVIAFLPFSTGLFDRYMGEPLAVVIYAGSLALARLALTAVWWYASAHRGLIGDTVSQKHIRFHRLRGLVIPLVFLLSIPIAFASVTAAIVVWIALFFMDQVLLHAFEERMA
jgi:uncharacterized membrane protein